MTTQQIAQAIATAFKESQMDIQNQISRMCISNQEATQMKIAVENSFFEMTIAYKRFMGPLQYAHLCDSIEQLAGQRFAYRP